MNTQRSIRRSLYLENIIFASSLFALTLLAGCSGHNPDKQPTSAPASEASIAPMASPAPKMTNVALKKDGGTFTVPVTINDAIKLNFVIDSGASDVQIPADVIITMVRSGTLDRSDFLGQKVYRLADGSELPSYIFRIRSLKIGDLIMHNITGSVVNTNGSLLLGQSFLSRVSSWSMDNGRGILVLGPEKQGGDVLPSGTHIAAVSNDTFVPDAPMTPDPASSSGNGLKDQMRTYLSVGCQNNLDAILAPYAAKVIYYGQVRSPDFIALDKSRYIKRWPQRSFQLRDESFSEKCSDASSCMISGIVDWSTSNPETGREASGVAQIVLGYSDGRITFETSKVVARPTG